MAIESQNIYKNARKSAGFTQEKASQLLNVSVDSLRDYEQSQRPVPSDVASAMCDVYQAPYLAVQHLRLTSDLGKRVVPEIQLKDLPEAVLGVLAAVQRFCAKREAMVEIAADGQIAESEQAEWDEIMRLANDLNVAMGFLLPLPAGVVLPLELRYDHGPRVYYISDSVLLPLGGAHKGQPAHPDGRYWQVPVSLP